MKNAQRISKKLYLNHRGITLIALIITIIVMLILVGVTVITVINNGMMKHAENATARYNTEQQKEANLNVTIGEKPLDDYISEIENSNVGKTLPTIGAGEKADEISKYETAIIPAGFTVSGEEGEDSVEEGLVIYLIDDKEDADIEAINWETEVLNLQKTYDQFVWIPTNVNEMYICQAKTSIDGICDIILNEDGEPECQAHKETDSAKAKLMAGRLYASTSGETFDKTLTNQTYNGAIIREPASLADYDNGTFYPTQSEYNEMVKSVIENNGFWVGRYETSGLGSSSTISVIKGTTNGISNVMWYNMYDNQKAYAESLGLKGGMIGGAAYDQVMKFVNTESYSVTTIENVAHVSSNFTTKPYQTGGTDYSTNCTASTTIPYNDISKNVYDLEGNIKCWTTEAYDTDYRLSRGGGYGSNRSASCRYCDYGPEGTSSSTRFTLSTLCFVDM